MKYFITFGQKYRREKHPAGGHPDGWFEVEADDYEEACDKIWEAMGEKWSMMYHEEDFGPESRAYYPRGKLRDL
jgi:hypothetical protein